MDDFKLYYDFRALEGCGRGLGYRHRHGGLVAGGPHALTTLKAHKALPAAAAHQVGASFSLFHVFIEMLELR